jgi:serine O-acetyltransferase
LNSLITEKLIESMYLDSTTCRLGGMAPPSASATTSLVDNLRFLMFPGFVGAFSQDKSTFEARTKEILAEISSELSGLCEAALRYRNACDNPTRGEELHPPHRMPQPTAEESSSITKSARDATARFLSTLPEVRRMLGLDVRAAFDGDPAARHADEVILCYPSIKALTVFRLAHELRLIGIPLLPRMMCELAHMETGIDIHPGATIGESFFIDHGTGVVIGETVVIGARCKLYQGVTLGARSFPRDEEGRITKGLHRHPTLEDDVVVYAGATILGGDTVIGARTEVAGGVFVTSSVPPDHVVAAPKAKTRIISRK